MEEIRVDTQQVESMRHILGHSTWHRARFLQSFVVRFCSSHSTMLYGTGSYFVFAIRGRSMGVRGYWVFYRSERQLEGLSSGP
jgi:hypothetical protein